MTQKQDYDPSYIHSINAAIESDREDLALELAADYDAERGATPAPTVTTASTASGRRLKRWRHRAARVRSSVDEYTLDTFNPSPLLRDSRR